MAEKHAPIGVFDSGVGGISVLRELVKEDGFPAFKAGVVYWGVRLLGSGNFKGDEA